MDINQILKDIGQTADPALNESGLFVSLLTLLVRDLFIVAILVATYLVLRYTRQASVAVIKRNFVGYFSNPTGYVFLCVFVSLTSFAAFWPHGFFNSNLANLEQLNEYLPLIMLIYIPTITMSIWSEERRERTDELLLTLPAKDFDIVVGKFLSAALIFTVSLLFSQFCNFLVLSSLARSPDTGLMNLDTGLLAANYFGYWLIGLTMLSLGMVGSFLTNNMTIAFVFGLILNVPLVAADTADIIIPSGETAQIISSLGIASQFDDFRRGVFSLTSTVFFLVVICNGLYLCMVLIGKRHWSGGRDGRSMWWHYLIRVTAIMGTSVAVILITGRYNVLRYDATAGKVSSLSEDTVALIKSLEPEHPIHIEAYISREVPEQYIRTKYELLTMLKEFGSYTSPRIHVTIHDDLEPYDDIVRTAEDIYGIALQNVTSTERDIQNTKQVIMGAVFRCGLDKTIVPFFEYGIPVEYEVARSLATVARDEKKRIGLINTRAQMLTIFNPQGGRPLPQQAILDELSKQYAIQPVNLNESFNAEDYDILFVVQPSSLQELQLSQLIDAINKGIPTAIFEDPIPQTVSAPPTRQPLRGRVASFQFGDPPITPKADIRRLWAAIGIESPYTMVEEDPGIGQGNPQNLQLVSPDVAWQDANPYPTLDLSEIDSLFYNFIPNENIQLGHPVTAGLEEILFFSPGAIQKEKRSTNEFVPLVWTVNNSGRINGEKLFTTLFDPTQAGQAPAAETIANLKKLQYEGDRSVSYLAAHIGGDASVFKSLLPKEQAATIEDPDPTASSNKPINVIYVADIDLMSSQFFYYRSRPDVLAKIEQRFENVTFLLNIFDALAGDAQSIAIRKREALYSTLRTIEERISDQRRDEASEIRKSRKTMQDKINETVDKQEQEITALQEKIKQLQASDEQLDRGVIRALIEQTQTRQREHELEKDIQQLREQGELDRKITSIRHETSRNIMDMQQSYKLRAVCYPPIPPLIIAFLVFLYRNYREREGVASSRLR